MEFTIIELPFLISKEILREYSCEIDKLSWEELTQLKECIENDSNVFNEYRNRKTFKNEFTALIYLKIVSRLDVIGRR